MTQVPNNYIAIVSDLTTIPVCLDLSYSNSLSTIQSQVSNKVFMLAYHVCTHRQPRHGKTRPHDTIRSTGQSAAKYTCADNFTSEQAYSRSTKV